MLETNAPDQYRRKLGCLRNAAKVSTRWREAGLAGKGSATVRDATWLASGPPELSMDYRSLSGSIAPSPAGAISEQSPLNDAVSSGRNKGGVGVLSTGQHLSTGKMRGLQQIANRAGTFAITAMDQRESLCRLLRPDAPLAVTYSELSEFKLDLVEFLAPFSSAVLLDPQFGAAQAIAQQVLPGSTGLIVTWERAGFTTQGDERFNSGIPDWSVGKVKRMGASAVKAMVYYRADSAQSADHQLAIVRQVTSEALHYDLPAIIEGVVYGTGTAIRGTVEYARAKPQLVIEAARDLAGLGMDVYKTQFPGELAFERDEGKLSQWCEQLNAACPVPWVVLSDGVDIDEFVTHIRIACQHGASGFLAGRAIWQDAARIASRKERRHWLATKGVANLLRCIDVAMPVASPWTARFGSPSQAVAPVVEGWERRYDAL